MVLKIAEAGVNHNGDLDLAKELVLIAKKSGADIVKFQTFEAEKLVTTKAKKAPYQNKFVKGKKQFEMLKDLELSKEDFKEVRDCCKSNRIEFLSTAFDTESLDFLVDLGIKRIKIPSGEITNFPLIRRAALHKLPIILSTGMSSMKEVKAAINVLVNHKVKKSSISVLHCTTEYPAPLDSINLNCLETLRRELDMKIGYSDHSEGVFISPLAVALGAEIIEKHFTKSRKLKGPDHEASLEPSELELLFCLVDDAQKSLGSSKKGISEIEKKNLIPARKSIVANKNIKKGEYFTEKNLAVKRPGDGLSPMLWKQIIGKKAKKNFVIDEKIFI